MSWRDRLQQGSFRGILFQCESSAREGGRRSAVHEFPGSDKHFVEDLGRRRRGYPIVVYVLGPDYMDLRDALIDALEMEGPGPLVHPYYGEIHAVVTDFTVNESSAEGGLARFNLTVIEAGKVPFPLESIDTAALVNEHAEAAELSAGDEFADGFGVEGQPNFVEDAAAADGNSMLDTFKAGAARIGQAAAYAEELSQELDDAIEAATGAVQSVTDPLATLARFPANLAAGILGGISKIRAIANDPLQALGLYKGMFGISGEGAAPARTTPARKAQAGNRSALENLMRTGAVIGAAKASAEATFYNAADAGIERDAMMDALDDLAAAAGDALYNDLAALRAAMVKDIDARAANLPRVVTFTPAAPIPALVISHRLYGDTAHEAEINARNSIRHPGFVPAGEPLEVLTNG